MGLITTRTLSKCVPLHGCNGHPCLIVFDGLQERLVERTRDYYRAKASSLVDSLTSPAYFAQVTRCRARESGGWS
mgnify:CR=1 FL=1